jgi:hypothetical protein
MENHSEAHVMPADTYTKLMMIAYDVELRWQMKMLSRLMRNKTKTEENRVTKTKN